MKRVFLVVLDSLGIGAMPDAAAFGDIGSDTLGAVSQSPLFHAPNLAQAGLFNIEGVTAGNATANPSAAYARLAEASAGKDTVIGHWEIAGVASKTPMRVYPDGFPEEVVEELQNAAGRKFLCNKPYSGTEVIKDFGKRHTETGELILYTSGDSVMQIAAHESVVPLEDLYDICRKARNIMQGDRLVGRIIARPFAGEFPNFVRTANRRDYAVSPPRETMLDLLSNSGFDVYAVGKIYDIFNGQGITRTVKTKNNAEGIAAIKQVQKESFSGLCFANLVDFDMLYGHRNDVDGYAEALSAFDRELPQIVSALNENDLLIITADHGCDPSTASTDHSREYVPLLVFGKNVRPLNLGTRYSFADIAASVLSIFEIDGKTDGKSFWEEIRC